VRRTLPYSVVDLSLASYSFFIYSTHPKANSYL
jgi:hypothetical protein